MRPIVQSWRTYWALGGAERDIARAAAFGLTTTWIGFRLFGFQRWNDFFVRRAVPSSAKKSQQRAWGVSAKRIAQLELAAAHNLFFRTNCLERSLVLWSLLRRHGFLAELKFGARKEDGKFEAHAWVELDGRALNNDAEAHHGFVPFDSTVTSVGTQSE